MNIPTDYEKIDPATGKAPKGVGYAVGRVGMVNWLNMYGGRFHDFVKEFDAAFRPPTYPQAFTYALPGSEARGTVRVDRFLNEATIGRAAWALNTIAAYRDFTTPAEREEFGLLFTGHPKASVGEIHVAVLGGQLGKLEALASNLAVRVATLPPPIELPSSGGSRAFAALDALRTEVERLNGELAGLLEQTKIWKHNQKLRLRALELHVFGTTDTGGED